ncbi:FAD-dependent monooxygenase [Streptomyces sp. PKU-EA00015]|uniref:FAD-dependent monooxygenase n=1 Tax=Streptomyces sp. PKU-EA00015 TaxID=2748326 RepID=UPI0035C7CA88
MENVSVLISGAGPTGLTLGLELARRGVPVRIIDKERSFTTARAARRASSPAPWRCSTTSGSSTKSLRPVRSGFRSGATAVTG